MVDVSPNGDPEGGNGALAESGEDSRSFPECPTCGRAIVATAVSEPAVGTAVPCGCTVVPPALEFDE
ncbi:hypothetical protein C493_01295 [Natronolimnohabitans innermongolicus JCM 12255]|uniref:Small CPxCG-related zinc finger protein n=1 Tax=Natronolimnohabitans innermongolicus JCM 12255 TaxID=1227499 RepID=L9XMI1_9EURY|nr:hypothetical protein C493_01295 [Natronolimnohabitans innermongolicus JCM 12255]